MQYTIISEAPSLLGESPVWDYRENRLYWIDFSDSKIHLYHANNNSCSSYTLTVMPGCVAPTENGNLLLGFDQRIGLFHQKEERLEVLFSPEEGKVLNHFNDGKCDASGRFWIGSMVKAQDQPNGALYKIEGRDRYEQVLDGVITSNGLVWSLDNTTFYYIDSMAFSVVAFDFDLATGTLANKRTIIDSQNEPGRLDGMTIDEEGFLWIAHWNGGQVTRWDPSTGKRVDRISLPAYNVTSCCFGGENLDTLFVTSASVDTDEETLKTYPQSGHTFALDLGIRGLKTHFVKGL